MHYIKALNLSLILSILVLLYGCSNQITQPQGPFSIFGNIVDKNGKEVKQAMVSINYGPRKYVNRDGSFLITNVNPPYNLVITVPQDSVIYFFKGLKTPNPICRLVNYISCNNSANFKEAVLNITYPRISEGERVDLKFLSKDEFQSLYWYMGDSSMQLRIQWPSTISCQQGKLVLLKYTLSNSIPLSFDNFGQKELTLFGGNNLNINFTFSDIQYNPEDTTISVDLPYSSYLNSARLSIVYNGYSKNSNLEIGYYTGEIPIYYIVPGTMPISFNIKYDLTLTKYECNYEKWAFAQPGSHLLFTDEPCIHLLYPSNDTTGVDYNTNFQFSGTTQQRINAFVFEGIYNVVILTNEEKTQLPYFEYCGFALPWDEQFDWHIQQYYNVGSMDEFVSPNTFSSNGHLNTISSSLGRHFQFRHNTTTSGKH